jgi:hypothetical protein
MILTVMITRTPAQQARVSLTCWTVSNGARHLHTTVFDPEGRLSAAEAALAGCEALAESLRRELARG